MNTSRDSGTGIKEKKYVDFIERCHGWTRWLTLRRSDMFVGSKSVTKMRQCTSSVYYCTWGFNFYFINVYITLIQILFFSWRLRLIKLHSLETNENKVFLRQKGTILSNLEQF